MVLQRGPATASSCPPGPVITGMLDGVAADSVTVGPDALARRVLLRRHLRDRRDANSLLPQHRHPSAHRRQGLNTSTSHDRLIMLSTLRNVLYGELWLCGGQSNMGVPLSYVESGANEIAAAQRIPLSIFACSRAVPERPVPTETGSRHPCAKPMPQKGKPPAPRMTRPGLCRMRRGPTRGQATLCRFRAHCEPVQRGVQFRGSTASSLQ